MVPVEWKITYRGAFDRNGIMKIIKVLICQAICFSVSFPLYMGQLYVPHLL
ncbi:hypothetical protein GLYMA_13G126800v4 [Glycine max]|uniref:Uncharacterized protein n=1 Tax=Glycine max TaxID=3847 RepID=K7LZD5_SOYBN|nr:hypothetical protein JHK87_036015 [Glycine soja]KAG4970410.1 hypothetical protein JHK85_036831 [Glycine max]KAG5130106.1 hypothetical protein JHK84_036503 [Glycine max]KAH1101205.1 hypothetical protein GYH30_036012 [Glycine max]KRH19623.1 hypothetical protein GLYMA_13G126800v4 [Glycine max]